MTKILCRECGREHDLDRIEPAFERPDAYVAVPREERQRRISDSDSACLIASEDRHELACFVRALLHVPITDEGSRIGWGLWVQIDDHAYRRVVSLWDDPDQAAEPPFPCTVANDIPNYPSTRGLPGVIRLTGPHTRPSLTLALDCEHAFAVEARTGVLNKRALEWRSWCVHGVGNQVG
jgi:hypothetical protein